MTIRAEVLARATEVVSRDRNTTYGEPEDSASTVPEGSK
jgi:hypothetical protein